MAKLRVPSRRIVNAIGAVGYSLLVSVYILMIGIGLIWLLNGGYLDELGIVAVEPSVEEASPKAAAGPISFMISIVVTILISLMTIFVAATLPYWLGRIGSRVLKRSIRLCQWSVTPRSLLFGKIIACGLASVPVAILVIYNIDNIVILLVISIALGLAALIFLIQHYLAHSTGLEAKEIW